MPLIQQVEAELRANPKRWLVTGAAGFIGSHLASACSGWGSRSSASTISPPAIRRTSTTRWRARGRARGGWGFIKGDCAEAAPCHAACEGADYVLHQAALGSVPRSIDDPLRTHRANVDGFIQMLVAARDAKVNRFVYASSSSVYGDEPTLPKVEDRLGKVLSPYAASKLIDEHYAATFERVYGLSCIGLRYFNVFGPRQDPAGAYAAVVPRWLARLARGERCEIFGDGTTSRDFCYVANAVQANVLAATAAQTTNTVVNVSVGGRTSLNALYEMLRERVSKSRPAAKALAPDYKPFRDGDIKDSQADIDRAVTKLGYAPTHDIARGLDETVAYALKAAS
ncbi:MAG: NAD-dependent epimerase/dehydratase family protein [Archangiaceae bacterium]|nr:NAD-dependent epimerase/dehydratase family protein [Archangiaceae bacterium]